MSHRSTDAMLTFDGARPDDPRVLEWFAQRRDPRTVLAQRWYLQLRACGRDVLELVHDGYPTVCIDCYPFAYVGAFKAHANIGFFYGVGLPDPHGLLLGSGKRMRHVKLQPGNPLTKQRSTR